MIDALLRKYVTFPNGKRPEMGRVRDDRFSNEIATTRDRVHQFTLNDCVPTKCTHNTRLSDPAHSFTTPYT